MKTVVALSLSNDKQATDGNLSYLAMSAELVATTATTEYRNARDDVERMAILRRAKTATFKELSEVVEISVETAFRRIRNYEEGFRRGSKLSSRYLTKEEEEDTMDPTRFNYLRQVV